MKNISSFNVAGLGLALVLSVSGCNSPKPGLTNQQQPGPAVGEAVGTGVGLVVGNAAGVVVGAGEGAVAGATASFKPAPVSTVQEYRTTVGPDGQIIRVPVKVQVDQYGRPINPPPPAQPLPVNGTNSVPPPASQP
jgi:hypothetical protein